MYDSLFSEILLGQTKLANRIMFGVHRTNLAQDGLAGEALIAYYRRRARGGCGAVIVDETSLHPGDHPWERMIELYHPQAAQSLTVLGRAIHDEGSRAFLCLNLHGFQSSGAITRRAVWGPSAVADIVFGETAKVMESEDIEAVVEHFRRGAILTRETGFDGLLVDMGPESLLRQFLSPVCNFRQDEYGGEITNRLRLPLAAIRAVRQAVGDDFTVGVNLCIDEKFWGGIDIQTAKDIATTLQDQAGVDFFNATLGNYYNLYLIHPTMHTPEGFAVELAEQLKQLISVPVITNHQIPGPHMADEIISQGRADAVGMVRPLICDPDLPRKAMEGRPERIRPCVRDNQGCVGRVNNSRAIACSLNPEVGRECKAALAPVSTQGTPRRVWVVGGGPAGLEAAAIAAQRDCRVLLLEKGPVLGGQINWAGRGAGRENMLKIIDYQTARLARLGVETRTGVTVTPEMITSARPDAVVVACGSSPHPKPYPGEYGPPQVLDVLQVLGRQYPVGNKLLLIDEDGGHRATATAELLADQGKQVTMVTEELFIGVGLASVGDLYFSRQRLLQKGVRFVCDVRVERLEGTRVVGREKFTNHPVVFDDNDTVVLAGRRLPEAELYLRLKGKVSRLFCAGDCVAPRNVLSAIAEGREAGEML